MFPENEEDRHYKWFKESIIHILGEDRTLQKACTKLIRRRLSPNENLNHYRIEFDVLWAEFLSTFENILAIEDEAEREKKRNMNSLLPVCPQKYNHVKRNPKSNLKRKR